MNASIDPELDPSFVVASIKRKRNRYRLWRVILLCLIPLGVAIPVTLSTMTENKDLLQYSGMAGLAIALTGLCGFVLTLFSIPQHYRELSIAVQAEQIGYRYANESEKESFLRLLQDSRMFYREALLVHVALVGESDNHSLALLGIEFSSGGGTCESSVVILAGAAEELPEFLMFPLGWFEALASKVMSDPGLKLPGEAEFNRKYKLRGEDAEAIIEYFTPQRIKYSLSDVQYTLEAKEDVLIVSGQSKLKDLAAMVELGKKTRKRFGS